MTLKDKIIRLLAKEHLLSAPEIVEHFAQKKDTYNKTSIYRALDRMQAQDIVTRQAFGNNDIYYELREHHHDHAVCTGCGTLKPVNCRHTEQVRIADFHTAYHQVTYFGVCGSCR